MAMGLVQDTGAGVLAHPFEIQVKIGRAGKPMLASWGI